MREVLVMKTLDVVRSTYISEEVKFMMRVIKSPVLLPCDYLQHEHTKAEDIGFY